MFAVASVQSSGESQIMFDLGDQGKFNSDCKSAVLGNVLKAHAQLTKGWWDLGDYPDALDTEQDDGNMLEMPIHSVKGVFNQREC